MKIQAYKAPQFEVGSAAWVNLGAGFCICPQLGLAIYFEMLPGIRIIPTISTSRSNRHDSTLNG